MRSRCGGWSNGCGAGRLFSGTGIATVFGRIDYHDTTCDASSDADTGDEAASYAKAGETA